MNKCTRARREKEELEWDCPGWDTWIRHADCQGAREGTSGWTACPVMSLDGEKAPLGHKKKGTQTTQTGFQEQPSLLSFLSTFCHFPSTSFSPLHSSIPGKLKKHDRLSVMESLWEGLIASSALFRCTNRPLLTIIMQSSSIIRTSSTFHALNVSQAPNLSLIVQKAMQACVWSQ